MTRMREFMGRYGHIWSKMAEIDAQAAAQAQVQAAAVAAA